MLPPDSPVLDAKRLAALKAADLLDTPPEEAFDQLARLACQILQTPVALVSLVDEERQFLKSCIGSLPEPFATDRQTPLTHSFCRYGVESGSQLIIEDTRADPLVMNNPMTTEHGVGAYAGFPLITSSGQTLGMLCVLDTKPRQWSQAQLDQLSSLASVVSTTIEYRSASQPAPPKLEEPSLVEADSGTGASLSEAIESYLARLDEYRRVAERANPTEELAQEGYWRNQILATEAAMLTAMEQYRRPSGKKAEPQADGSRATTGAELAQACEYYFDAQWQRAEAMASFQRAETSLEQVERAGALMLQAEQALRSAARSYSLSSA